MKTMRTVPLIIASLIATRSEAAVTCGTIVEPIGSVMVACQFNGVVPVQNDSPAITASAATCTAWCEASFSEDGCCDLIEILPASRCRWFPTADSTNALPVPASFTFCSATVATDSPTPAPTASPTVSPTASPTTQCSRFSQTFTVRETGPLGCSSIASSACSSSPGASGFKRSFIRAWSADPIFDHVRFRDVKRHVSVSSVADGTAWVHTVTIQYKPETPLSHTDLNAAAAAFIAAGPIELSFCMCTQEIIIESFTSSYIMAEPRDSLPDGRCRWAYRPPRGMGMRQRSRREEMEMAAPTSKSTTHITAMGAGLFATVVVGAILAVARIIHRRNADPQNPVVLEAAL
eukprot:m.391093 g.391093  ORF g.391093 m.391093 type:complete len:348 (-) comp16759_c2_seq1:92-1135(-)